MRQDEPTWRDYKDFDGLVRFLGSDLEQYVEYHLATMYGYRMGEPQRQVCQFLQEPGRRKMVIAFRGFSKTTLIKMFVGWRHLRVPFLKVKIYSNNHGNASRMATDYLSFLRTSPVMEHLAPTGKVNRNGFFLLDQPREKDPHLDCWGIDASTVSQRCDLAILDDVEDLTNSVTPILRSRLCWNISDIHAILHDPGRFYRGKDGLLAPIETQLKRAAAEPEGTQLVCINTYTHGQSIFLPTDDPENPLRGVQRLVLPAIKRDDDNPKAEEIGGLEGKWVATWPERKPMGVIQEARKQVGQKFYLDYLCDVKAINQTARVIDMRRVQTTDGLSANHSYCFVDPAQGGNCETAAAFGGPVDSRLFVSDILAWSTQPSEWIPALVAACKERRVVELHVEAKPEGLIGFIQNEILKQGGGLVLRKLVPKGDKTLRITGTLDYPINSGKVVFHNRVLQDAKTKDQLETLSFQPIDKNAVVDRLDALTHLVAAFAHIIGRDTKVGGSARFG